MDLGLSAELGLDWMHRQAVRLHTTIAAAFADRLVDEDAHFRVGQPAALAQPPLLGGAALVVHEGGDAGDVPEQPLSLVEPVAVPHFDTRSPHGALRILV